MCNVRKVQSCTHTYLQSSPPRITSRLSKACMPLINIVVTYYHIPYWNMTLNKDIIFLSISFEWQRKLDIHQEVTPACNSLWPIGDLCLWFRWGANLKLLRHSHYLEKKLVQRSRSQKKCRNLPSEFWSRIPLWRIEPNCILVWKRWGTSVNPPIKPPFDDSYTEYEDDDEGPRLMSVMDDLPHVVSCAERYESNL